MSDQVKHETQSPVDLDALAEARDALRVLVEFAYEMGFHEMGYDPLAVACPPISVCPTCEWARTDCRCGERVRELEAENARLTAACTYVADSLEAGGARDHFSFAYGSRAMVETLRRALPKQTLFGIPVKIGPSLVPGKELNDE